MPIDHGLRTTQISKDEYHNVDYEVMRLAFAVHNDLGRLCDEGIYESELEARCKDAGLAVARQVPLVAEYKEFCKPYLLDLVINNSIIYELKTVQSLIPRHHAQLLNYLMLAEQLYGKLINLRPTSVEHEFVTTRLTRARRGVYKIHDSGWLGTDERGVWFRDVMEALLAEWGAFLDVGLYRDAVVFFLGGEDEALLPVDVVRNGRVLGRQKAYLLAPGTVFEITAMGPGQASYRKHLQRFLSHTRLKRIHWVNLNRHDITFSTLEQ